MFADVTKIEILENNEVLAENAIIELLDDDFKQDPLICPNNCGTVFHGKHRKQNVKRHLNLTCKEIIPQYQCKYCKKTIRNKRSLDYHLMSRHPHFML